MREELTQRMQAKGYITVAEAAKQAGVPPPTMYSWLDRKLIRSRKLGGGRYVHAQSLKEYLK